MSVLLKLIQKYIRSGVDQDCLLMGVGMHSQIFCFFLT